MPDIKKQTNTSLVLALCRYSSVTPRLLESLLRRFYSLEAIMSADVETLSEINGVDRDLAIQIDQAQDYLDDAAKFEKSLNDRDVTILCRVDEEYPEFFLELNDPPPLLYIRGSLPNLDNKRVTVVGSQVATAKGLELTSSLVKELVAADVQIISSLSGGNDTAAHLACKSSGGVSFALIEGGMDHLIGEGMIQLGIDISEKGGIISEEPPEIERSDLSMTQTNRLLAGLSHAVIVTESYKDSKRVEDIIRFCNDIGKLLFYFIDPDQGAHADEESLSVALECGAIPIKGVKQIPDIVKSLV